MIKHKTKRYYNVIQTQSQDTLAAMAAMATLATLATLVTLATLATLATMPQSYSR